MERLSLSLSLLFFLYTAPHNHTHTHTHTQACSIIDVLIYAQADDDNKDTRRILAMIPSMPFFVGMRILIQASVGSTSTGMGWSEFNSNSIPPADGELDQWSLQTSFDWLFSTWIL